MCAASAAAGHALTPKYKPGTVPLAQENDYFRDAKNTSADYWALAAFYVPQPNGYSCSAASAEMAFNALLNARRNRLDTERNTTLAQLTEQPHSFDWQKLTSATGLDGRHGVTLAQLATALRESLAALKAGTFTVTAVEISSANAETVAAFRRALTENETNPDNIMLLHFSQDIVTGAEGGPYPHVSPVGAHNATTNRVLIMDVDRQWYEPYWCPAETIVKAMAVKTAAFGYGGYVTITVPAAK